MQQTLLITLFSFLLSSFMVASTDSITDKMAVIGSPGLSSDPCAAIDKKLIKLDEFTTMVNNTSAFHLEEKASALPVPGITVSNNKKKMLRDAKKKYAEYSAERKKYSCENPMPAGTAKMAVVAKSTEVEAVRQKDTVETPMPASSTDTIADKKTVVSKPVLSSEPSAAIDKKPLKQDKVTTKVNVSAEEKASSLLVPASTASNKKEQMPKVEKKKSEAIEVEHPKYATETSTPVTTARTVEKKAVVSEPVLSSNSSDACAAINKKLIKLYQFTIMVNNTSSFHLEEKASALSVPGISVSNNKKKMLRDAEKKGKELLKERQKYGCDTTE